MSIDLVTFLHYLWQDPFTLLFFTKSKLWLIRNFHIMMTVFASSAFVVTTSRKFFFQFWSYKAQQRIVLTTNKFSGTEFRKFRRSRRRINLISDILMAWPALCMLWVFTKPRKDRSIRNGSTPWHSVANDWQ